jgi:hypothetical protein
LVTKVLTKALRNIAEIIQAQMNVQSKGSGCLIPRATAMRQRDASPSGEGTSKHLSLIEFSWTGPQIVRNQTPKDHQSHNQTYRNGNFLGKAKFTSSEGYAGTWAQQAQGVDHRSICLFLTWWGPALFIQIG